METITLIFSEYEIEKYLDVGEENGFTHSNTINFLAMLKKQEKIAPKRNRPARKAQHLVKLMEDYKNNDEFTHFFYEIMKKYRKEIILHK